MTKAQHTPGPWVAVGCQVEVLSDSIPDICNTNPETFGQHGRSDKERIANASLIAAAPDLLAALTKAEAAVNRSVSGLQTYTVPDWVQLLATMQSAITKATRSAA